MSSTTHIEPQMDGGGTTHIQKTSPGSYANGSGKMDHLWAKLDPLLPLGPPHGMPFNPLYVSACSLGFFIHRTFSLPPPSSSLQITKHHLHPAPLSVTHPAFPHDTEDPSLQKTLP